MFIVIFNLKQIDNKSQYTFMYLYLDVTKHRISECFGSQITKKIKTKYTRNMKILC